MMCTRSRRRQGLMEPLEPRYLLSLSAATTTLLGAGNDPQVAGDLLRPSADSQTWMDQHLQVTQSVNLNELGLSRINQARVAAGLPALTVQPVTLGSESIGVAKTGLGIRASLPSTGAAAPQLQPAGAALASGTATSLAVTTATGLSSVDNSATQYFPDIRSQGSLGSCAAFSTTYYTMTYMTALARGWDVSNPADNAHRFSPKWTYNMLDGGVDGGSWITDAYNIMLKDGAATWDQFAYDSNYTAWVYNAPATWRSAIGYRMNQTGSVASVDTDTGLANIKSLLTNGYVLNFATDISGWQITTVRNDSSTSADDPFVGQAAASWVASTSSGHAMTIVGYNDNIWIDVNGNGVVDPGEKGAFKIANSWGSGWGNNGYIWLSYDAVKGTSAVTGGPNSNREAAFWYNTAYWITARSSYTPTVLAEVTVQHASRNQMELRLGTGSIGSTTPSATWYPSALLFQGGPLGFDGKSYAGNPAAAPAGTFVFDFSDLLPNLSTATRYFVSLDDTTDPTVGGTITAYKLTDASGNVLTSALNGYRGGDLPVSDYDTAGVWADTYVDYPATSITGSVFGDLNRSGSYSPGDPQFAGWTVYQDTNGNGSFDTVTNSFTNSTAVTIPDRSSRMSTVTVSGLTNVVSHIRVTVNITHGRDSDLKLTLTSPTGQKVQLFAYVGGTNANFTNTVFDDNATTPIGQGAAPFTGMFKPTNSLTTLEGISPNGNWTLTAYDMVSGYSGMLNNWALALTTAEPYALTNAAGAYTLNRLAAGSYSVRVAASPGFNVIAPIAGVYNDVVTAQQTLAGQDFAVYAPPTVAAPASAGGVPVAGPTTNVSVLGASFAGESTLTYIWSTVAKPAGAADVAFAANASNAAKGTTATFNRAGVYTLRATITDGAGQSVTSDVNVTVNQILTSILVNPPATSVPSGGTLQFVAIAYDEFGQIMPATFNWSATEGTISSDGLFTADTVTMLPGAGNTASLVTASVASYTAQANVTVVPTSFLGLTGPDQYYLRMDPLNPTMLQIWANANPATCNPSYEIALDVMPTLTFAGGEGGDVCTLDFTNGSPIPASGVTFDGGTATNSINLIGTGLTDTFTLTDTTLYRGGTSILSYANVANLNVQGATITADGNIAFAGNVSVGSTAQPAAFTIPVGMTVTVGSFLVETGSTLTVNGDFEVMPSPTPTVNILRGHLTLGGCTDGWISTFDLNNNDLVVQIPPKQDVNATYTILVNQLKSGSQGGIWTGTTGITSKTATNSNYTMGLGAVMNASLLKSGIGYTTFDGQAVDANSILIKYTFMGDENLDGNIDSLDYYFIDSAFNNNLIPNNQIMSGYINGDFNYDGNIDSADYFFIDSAHNNLDPISVRG